MSDALDMETERLENMEIARLDALKSAMVVIAEATLPQGQPNVSQYMTPDAIMFNVDNVEILRLEKDQIFVRGQLAATDEEIVTGLRYFVSQARASFGATAVARLLELPQNDRARSAWQLLESLDKEKQADLLSRFALEHGR